MATIVAIAMAAYATTDLVHEVLGHGVAVLLSPGIRATALTTVALQTTTSSRWVAAAGSIANVVVGSGAYALFHHRRFWDPWTLFLALSASTNLLNGTGYLFFSALLNFGDWAVVIGGATPAWAWRTVMGLVGAISYGLVIRGGSRSPARLIRLRLISRDEPRRVLIPAYIAGGLLFVLAAAMNPIGPQLILTSGVSSGFGAMAGLAYLPFSVEARTDDLSLEAQPLPFSIGWCVAGAVIALLFVGVAGPGIQL